MTSPRKPLTGQINFLDDLPASAPTTPPAPSSVLDSDDSIAREAKKSPAAAPASAAAWLYQFRLAALRALRMEPGEVLGVEVIDDFDVRGRNGTFTITQVKATAEPLTNMDEGFWKALKNWAALIHGGTYDEATISQLIFATTAEVRGNIPGAFLPGESRQIRDIIKAVHKIQKSDDPKLDGDIATVKKSSDSQLETLFRKIRVEQSGNANEIVEQIKAELHRSFRPEHVADACTEFEGWFVQMFLAAYHEKQPALISAEQVYDRIQAMRDRLLPRSIRHRHHTLPTKPQRDDYKTHLFLQQLDAIGCSNDMVDIAVLDYLRCGKERADWAKHGEIGLEDLDNYDRAVEEAWRDELVFGVEERDQHDESKNGRQLYGKVMNRTRVPSIGPHQFMPDGYVYKGACQLLADEPKIGWHPRWEQLFSSPESTTKSDEPEQSHMGDEPQS